MARDTVFYSLAQVAAMIDENVELIEITVGSDTIDDGEMIRVVDGTEDGITAFSTRGIENLREFLADVRSWAGGILRYLLDQACAPDLLDRVMADERQS